MLQPLSIAVNKSFKDNLKKKREDWMSSSKSHSFTKTGKLRRAPYATICTWIKESFEEVPVSCIKNGSNRAMMEDLETKGITLAMIELSLEK